ncbi:hypothetical protein [Armatimonas sp.]|uniref:hypothetical protein n=1 Tax=Armatimonas sp. TaxID=1872638 RepID=UPI003752C145
MELTPADLGDSRAIALFQMRAAQVNASQRPSRRLHNALLPVGKSTLLSRMWAKETGLTGEAAQTAVNSASRPLYGIAGGLGGGWGFGFGFPALLMAAQAGQRPEMLIMAGIFGAMSLTGFGIATFLPGNLVRRWGKTPLNAHELDTLLAQEEDELERSYLLLIREALDQPSLPDAAQKELKEAIKVLGMALDRLPPAPAETANRNTEGLRSEAEGLRQQALTETDRVASESLERRADALERSASAMEKSATFLRRNSLLRQELQAQLEALRLELGSTSVTGADVGSLAQVASVARGVAREADALATARAELDTPQLQKVGISS